MPLQLGGTETVRPHVLVWNPMASEEALDAQRQRDQLLALGFRVRTQTDGEIVLDPPPRNPNVGVLRVLSQNGDDRLVWDRRDPDQVKEMYAKFKDMLAKGYTAYATRRDGTKGHKITEFNPGLEEILMVPKTIPG